MYRWILSVNLNYNVYQVESGEASFAGEPIAMRGQYDRLLAQISQAILPEYRDRLLATFQPAALAEAFRSGRTNVSTFICLEVEGQPDPICMELRVERIPEENPQSFAALIFARRLRDEDDHGEIYSEQVPVELTDDGDIDWASVRARKYAGGDNSMHYEYCVAEDRFILHMGKGDNIQTQVLERYLATLDARSDYLIFHDSIKPVKELLRTGISGHNGEREVAMRAGGKRSSPFRHYKMTCIPLEDSGKPSWLFGDMVDIEEDYKKRASLQDMAVQIGAIVERVFSDMYVIDTAKDTICHLVKTEGGYRSSDQVQKFTEYITQRIEKGIVAPESVEICRRLLQKGYLERKAGQTTYEMDVRLKPPGRPDYGWYVDTYSPVPGKPHCIMLSRRDITSIYDSRQREYELGESLRLAKYNQSMLDTMAGLVEFRNMETGAHIHHVRTLSRILMEDVARRSPQYGMTARQIDMYCQASTMHDIGKISVPDSILNKPGRLTDEEYSSMKLHTTNGANIIQSLVMPGQDDLKKCCWDVAMHHHERWDGRGYPEGLVGDDNSIYVQAIGLADVFDALVSERCYKKSYSYEEAEKMIFDGQCGAFNPRLLESFSHCRYVMRQEYEIKEEMKEEEAVYGN